MTRQPRLERAAAWLDATPLRPLVRAMPTWRGVLVLNYHRVGEFAGQPWDRTLWSTSAEGLDGHVRELQRHVDIVGPEDLPEIAARGRGRHAVLTFDDGYRDNYEIAFPILRRHGARAVFFLATGFLDAPHAPWWDEIAWMMRNARRQVIPAGSGLARAVPITGPDDDDAIREVVETYKRLPGDRAEALLDHVAAATGSGRCPAEAAASQWMSWDMARELRAAGMAIGGHTVTHPVLAGLDEEAQAREVTGCAQRLREELGEPMRWFAYPVGARSAFDERTRAILTRAGVQLAFSFYGGHQPFRGWDPLDVRRINVSARLTPELLRATVRLPQVFARPV